MEVKLISVTQGAMDLLIFTKRTRLEMDPNGLDAVRALSMEEKLAELEYMANTIPSSWEFVDYTFLVTGVSRAYTHQQVRTRSASYAQQTMRVLDMSKGYQYVHTERNKADPRAMAIIADTNNFIRESYEGLINLGQPVEDARGILPTNIATNIVCKFTLRTMAELARSRSGGRTQGEYQSIVLAMIEQVLAVHPWAEKFFAPKGRDYFKDIEAFAEKKFGGDLLAKGELLKIVDKMRKEQ